MSGVGGFEIRGRDYTFMAPSQNCSGCRSGFMACRERERERLDMRFSEYPS